MSNRKLVCSICGDDPVDEDEFERWKNTPNNEPIVCDCCWVTAKAPGTYHSRTPSQHGPNLFDSDDNG